MQIQKGKAFYFLYAPCSCDFGQSNSARADFENVIGKTPKLHSLKSEKM